MKHILTSTALLLATATAINAQSSTEESLQDAIYGDVSPYLTSLIENNVEIVPDAISELAYEAAYHWNLEHQSVLQMEYDEQAQVLVDAQGEVENLTNQYQQSQQHLNTANANLKAAKAEVTVQEGLVTAKIAEIDSLNALHITEIGNLQDDLDALGDVNTDLQGQLDKANQKRKEANEQLGDALLAKMQLEDDLDAANEDLEAAEAQVDSLMDMLDTVATQRDKAVLDRQEAIADLATANANLDLVTAELQSTETDFNALKTRVVKAGNKPYKVMGDVLQVSKDNNTYSGNSYDIGKISSSTVDPGLYLKDYTEISNIRIKGKYSEFNIATDLRLSKNSGNLAEFNSVIAEVKNAMYNEGYKDGYNDGFEDGYNVGYGDAVSDIKGN